MHEDKSTYQQLTQMLPNSSYEGFLAFNKNQLVALFYKYLCIFVSCVCLSVYELYIITFICMHICIYISWMYVLLLILVQYGISVRRFKAVIFS